MSEQGGLVGSIVPLDDILDFDVTDEEREELLQREAECDRGEVVQARVFLDELRHRSA